MDNEIKFRNVEYMANLENARIDSKKRIVLDNTVMDAILNEKKVFIVVVESEIANEEEV